MGLLKRGPIAGSIVVLLIALNTVLVCVPFFAVTIGKLAAPVRRWRQRTTRVLERLANGWIGINLRIFEFFHRTRWEVDFPEDIRRDEGYVVLSNHQSWVDVFAVQRVLRGRTPFVKFFLKRELFFLPLLGQAWWALDYPFMRRYDKKKIEEKPERRHRDIRTTRRALERARGVPTAVLNFVEGTRFSWQKHKEQGSPFRHLLRPKAGGVAHAITALGDQVRHVLDVTIFYPDARRSFWDFVSGRMQRIVVRVRRVPVPHDLAAAYDMSAEGRERFRAWLEELWAEKDRELAMLAAREGQAATV